MSSPSSSVTHVDSSACGSSKLGKRKTAPENQEAQRPSKSSKVIDLANIIDYSCPSRHLPFQSIVDDAIKALMVLNKDTTPELQTWNARKAVPVVRLAFEDIRTARKWLAAQELEEEVMLLTKYEAYRAYLHLTEWILEQSSEEMVHAIQSFLEGHLVGYLVRILDVMEQDDKRELEKEMSDFLELLSEHEVEDWHILLDCEWETHYSPITAEREFGPFFKKKE